MYDHQNIAYPLSVVLQFFVLTVVGQCFAPNFVTYTFFLTCLKLLIVYACDTNVNTFCFFESWCNYSNFSWILARSAARKPSYKNSLKQEISPCRLARKFTFQALPAKSKVTLYGRPIVDHVDHILHGRNWSTEMHNTIIIISSEILYNIIVSDVLELHSPKTTVSLRAKCPCKSYYDTLCIYWQGGVFFFN